MPQKILRIKEVSALTGLPRSSVFALVRAGRFPPSVKIAGRRSGWNARSVEDWIATRLAGVSA